MVEFWASRVSDDDGTDAQAEERDIAPYFDQTRLCHLPHLVDDYGQAGEVVQVGVAGSDSESEYAFHLAMMPKPPWRDPPYSLRTTW